MALYVVVVKYDGRKKIEAITAKKDEKTLTFETNGEIVAEFAAHTVESWWAREGG